MLDQCQAVEVSRPSGVVAGTSHGEALFGLRSVEHHCAGIGGLFKHGLPKLVPDKRGDIADEHSACGSIIQRDRSPLRDGVVLLSIRITTLRPTSFQPLGGLPQLSGKSGVVVNLDVKVDVEGIAQSLPDVGHNALE